MTTPIRLPRKLFVALVVAQQKGGVGKTTLARMLGEWFAIVRGWRTLLIDFDPSCSLSKLMLDMDGSINAGARPPLHPSYEPSGQDVGDWTGRSSSAGIFFGADIVPYPVVRPATDACLDILPGNAQLLLKVGEQQHTQLRGRVEELLREFMQTERSAIRKQYDIVIIDTPPSKFLLTRAAMRAATHLLIPIKPEQQCIEALGEMLMLWRHENARRPNNEALEIAAMQWNLVKATRSHDRMMMNSLAGNDIIKKYISPIVLTDRTAFVERDLRMARPRSIFQLPPSNEAQKMARQFCGYLERRLNSDHSIPQDAVHA
jgi:chromosome partitioning protein